MHPVSTKKADSYQRTYFMAGVLARLCHQNAKINCEVRGKSLYVNNIFIMTQSAGDENLNNIRSRMNGTYKSSVDFSKYKKLEFRK